MPAGRHACGEVEEHTSSLHLANAECRLPAAPDPQPYPDPSDAAKDAETLEKYRVNELLHARGAMPAPPPERAICLASYVPISFRAQVLCSPPPLSVDMTSSQK